MIKKSIVFALLSISCVFTEIKAQRVPVDKSANDATKRLFNNLFKQSEKGFMFGHQEDLAYDVGWKNIDGESDVNKVHKMGGVNTITWHLSNPLNGKSAWDVDSVIKHIMVGSDKYTVYESRLSKVSVFLNSLKDKNGNAIPLIFRPFHQHNGSWFWYGKKHGSSEEYKKLYQQIVKYMGNKEVHNILYAYSTDNFPDESDYLERYPGDDFVDILGFDTHHRKAPESNKKFVRNLDRMFI